MIRKVIALGLVVLLSGLVHQVSWGQSGTCCGTFNCGNQQRVNECIVASAPTVPTLACKRGAPRDCTNEPQICFEGYVTFWDSCNFVASFAYIQVAYRICPAANCT
ncbi:hypothetical protein Sinac_7327 [Singulisphaera acidiphila DSM 18658]|uniref:Uncharacterized protein n=1 Tax=Singulisphaera acidiphila (strain ATCC BAA-1392 / DSM 18658 / VKM B-2454 / MOB10) TaxID=886293 RepID=L0DQY3_SINAD|nr:hypothetical protein Sinac_7327 [Singulisphaera acidiphila DSM 18658]